MNNNNFKKIQILGNAQVSGYFSFCRLVNYDNMNQIKTIKKLSTGGICNYIMGEVPTPFLNIMKHNDLLSQTNIGFPIRGNYHLSGVSELGSYFYKGGSGYNYRIFSVPSDYHGDIFFVGNCYRVFESSNKSVLFYVLLYDDFTRLYVNLPSLKWSCPISGIVNDNLKVYSVTYVDFCISTNVPLVMEYLGEIEVMQSDNKKDVNNSFFMINRYDDNPL